MLTTAEALQAVLSNAPAFGSETISTAHATGRVLHQSIEAERDQPPFDRVMMDGIALSFADYSAGQRQFPLQSLQAAGDPALTLQSGNCIEIMTGAACPVNADCIVPVERIRMNNNVAEIEENFDVVATRYIHPRGSDFRQGATLLSHGKQVSPLDIAVVASCGVSDLTVAADPDIRVISTGNELVPAGQPVAAHQIRLSNGPALVSLLGAHHYRQCEQHHIVDDLQILREQLATHLDKSDVLILSGGVSMGKADYVPQVLSDLGVDLVFHKVSQRPGKPMWFGMGAKKQMVFALPGNPVSALVCCRQYVLPALHKASGRTAAAPEFAALAAPISFKPMLTNFQPVRLISNAAGQTLAMPVKTNTSGDFASLSATDGYVELPSDSSEFAAGTAVFLHRWIAA